MLDNPRADVYNRVKERRCPHNGQLPSLSVTLENMTATVWKSGRSFFLSLFFRIVFCAVRVTKNRLGERPSDLGRANDDSDQKGEQGENIIPNFHNGIPP